MTAALFEEVRPAFADKIGFSSSGGPMRSTSVVVMGSNAESRVARWRSSRRQWDINMSKLSLDVQAQIIAHFEAMNAQLIGWRFRDPLDFQSGLIGDYNRPVAPTFLDQVIALGDGATKIFQLYKLYTVGSQTYSRKIRKPVSGTGLIGVAGVKKTVTTDYTIDYTTGLVTFVSAPAYGASITAGYQFDVPVRFNTDKLDQMLTDPGAASIASLPIIELSPSELGG